MSAAVLVACGGGGGSDGTGSNASSLTGTLSGTATKGPVSGATVEVFAITSGARGSQLGSATTDSSGSFTMAVHPYTGPVMLQMHGGSYPDEATGSRMRMLDTDDMTCAVPNVAIGAGSAVTGVQITPLTTMAESWAAHMSGGLSEANITMANMRIGAVYVGPGADILMTRPIDPTVSGSANGASVDARNYGLILAAMSQEAHELGMMLSSSAMITAMLDDASDGVMNGMTGSTAIDMDGMGGMMGGGSMMSTTGTTQLMTAMADFINGPMNRSGVTDVAEMHELMDRMTQFMNSGGHF
jgi:hypothetical protein